MDPLMVCCAEIEKENPIRRRSKTVVYFIFEMFERMKLYKKDLDLKRQSVTVKYTKNISV
jgi:hypothetical protein